MPRANQSPRKASVISSQRPRITSGNVSAEAPRSITARPNSESPRQRQRGVAGLSSFGTDIMFDRVANSNTHALSLNSSSSQYMSIADASQTGLDLSTAFTVSFWVRFDKTPTSGNRMAFIQKWEVGQQAYFLSFQNQSGVLTFEAVAHDGSNFDKVTWPFAISGSNISTNGTQWYHIAYTFDASQATASEFELYINGISQGNGDVVTDNNITSIANRTSPFGVGANGAGTVNFFNGEIDELRVYNVVRTASQILQDMRDEVNDSAGLVAYWKFNNDASDATSNSNDLTNNNSATFVTAIPFTKYGPNTRIYVGSGDGYTGDVLQTNIWATAHDAATSSEASSTNATGTVSIEKGSVPLLKWTIRRCFLPFDTSALTDAVQEAHLYLDVTTAQHDSNTPEPAITVVQTTQDSTGTITTADYDQFGTVQGITAVDLIDVNVTQTYFTLNSTGASWIDIAGDTKLGLRLEADAINDPPSLPANSEDKFIFRFSETSGTTNDPYLDITT